MISNKHMAYAFTLVEMLVVIIIIVVLLFGIIPKIQGAQARARDVSRKQHLEQISSAIILSQKDEGIRPGFQCRCSLGLSISNIKNKLMKAGLSSVPEDPNGVNINYGLGVDRKAFLNEEKIKLITKAGDYLYMTSTKNGSIDAGFILMAKTETEGGSNWIVCPFIETEEDISTVDQNSYVNMVNNIVKTNGIILPYVEINNIHPCTSFINGDVCKKDGDVCYYSEKEQLRYIYTY